MLWPLMRRLYRRLFAQQPAQNGRGSTSPSPSLSEEELEKRLREEARRYEHDLRELAKT